MNVVLDTNVLVSGMYWKGNPHRIVQACVSGRLRMVCCPQILDEYVRVMADPVFGATQEELAEWVALLVQVAFLVEVAYVEPVVENDPSDDIFLACAIAGGAKYIVTGDRHLLKVKEHRGVRIVNPRVFVKESGI